MRAVRLIHLRATACGLRVGGSSEVGCLFVNLQRVGPLGALADALRAMGACGEMNFIGARRVGVALIRP